MLDNSNLNLNPQELQKVDTFRKSRKTAVLTLLFTDIVEYTKFTEAVGDVKSNQIRGIHDKLFNEIITKDNAGEIIKQIGDSFFAVFAEPSTAVERILEFQNEIKSNKERLSIGKYTLRVRAGLHLGQVSLDNQLQEDIFGTHVNKASRIMSLASGGQVLASNAVKENAATWLKNQVNEVKSKYYGKAKLKGIKEATGIYEIFYKTQKAIGRPKNIIIAKIRKYIILFSIIIASILLIDNFTDINNKALYVTISDEKFADYFNKKYFESKGQMISVLPLDDSLLQHFNTEMFNNLISHYYNELDMYSLDDFEDSNIQKLKHHINVIISDTSSGDSGIYNVLNDIRNKHNIDVSLTFIYKKKHENNFVAFSYILNIYRLELLDPFSWIGKLKVGQYFNKRIPLAETELDSIIVENTKFIGGKFTGKFGITFVKNEEKIGNVKNIDKEIIMIELGDKNQYIREETVLSTCRGFLLVDSLSCKSYQSFIENGIKALENQHPEKEDELNTYRSEYKFITNLDLNIFNDNKIKKNIFGEGISVSGKIIGKALCTNLEVIVVDNNNGILTTRLISSNPWENLEIGDYVKIKQFEK